MSSLSISSSSSSNTSSIYSDRTVISGLASGLDTETLIEEAVSGYQTKITSLQAEVTKYEWKQEAYQDIITPMVNFSSTYTSYSSNTNLASLSFFNNATKVTTNGEYADMISASGRTSSEVVITQVTNLATAARYNGLGSGLSAKSSSSVTGDVFSLDENSMVKSGKFTGSMTLGYGGTSVSIVFSSDEVFEDAQSLADAINEKLADETISFDSGNSSKASECIKAEVDGDTIKLVDTSSGKNTVWVSSASSAIKNILGISPSSSDTTLNSFTFGEAEVEKAVNETDTLTYLSSTGFSITLDGTTKTIKGPTEAELEEKYGSDWTVDEYVDMLNETIKSKFGSTTTLQVTNVLENTSADGTDRQLQLQFSVDDKGGSTFQVSSSGGAAVGLDGSLSNYVDTSSTLKSLLGSAWADYAETDDDGNEVYNVTINGQTITVDEDTTVSTLMSKINSNEEMGLSVAYSKTTKQFGFTASETGTAGQISMDSDLAKALFGETISEKQVEQDYDDKLADLKEQKEQGTLNDTEYEEKVAALDADKEEALAKVNVTAGQNAKLTAVVNGVTKELDRASNSIDIDGLTVKLKGTFNKDLEDISDTSSAVTFTITSDADTIVDAIKSMISDYNSIITAVKSAYTTYPAQKSDGSSYEPLSDDDKADMSDTAIENYEKKAKQGLLFMDSDLSSLYNALRNCFSDTSLSAIGISTSYSDGLTTVTLDESKLREVLEDDPDKVRDMFTNSVSNGDSSDGLMAKLSTVFSRYASTTGATKGILIEKAGSSLASSSLTTNTWYKAIQSLEEQIEKWQDKMSDKVDYYTTKFTNLETLISEMNSQSSMLSSLSGSY